MNLPLRRIWAQVPGVYFPGQTPAMGVRLAVSPPVPERAMKGSKRAVAHAASPEKIAAVLATYKRTGSIAETARQQGVGQTSVYRYLQASRGKAVA